MDIAGLIGESNFPTTEEYLHILQKHRMKLLDRVSGVQLLRDPVQVWIDSNNPPDDQEGWEDFTFITAVTADLKWVWVASRWNWLPVNEVRIAW